MIAQLMKNPPAMQETPVPFLGREDPLERDRLSSPIFLSFPRGSVGKESTSNAGDLGLIPGLGRSSGEGKATHSSILAGEFHGLYRIPWTDSSSSIFLSQDFFGSFGSLVCPYRVKFFCFSSVKNAVGNLIEIALKP